MTMQNTASRTIRRARAVLAPTVPAARISGERAARDFFAAYPDYAATSRLDELRAIDYSYLDKGGHTYLEYTGAGLVADTELRVHAERLRGGCFGNPHSESPTSNASTRLIAQAKAAVLRYFNAAAGEYSVIFTQNATGACRLVGEAYKFRPLSRFVLTADNQNSVNGMREFARAGGAAIGYIPLSPADLRVTDENVAAALEHGVGGRDDGADRGGRHGLFAYPAQSNFSGVQHSLAWVDLAQAAGYDVLLDAAAFVPANRLDLGAVKPEFVTVSFYKMFGYPTGIGCLLARRDAIARLRRPWFSGGTIWGASVQGGWHRLADDETAFEDGTVNFLAKPDITTGLAWISDIGAFNFLDARGAVVDAGAVARDTSAARISVRTGCFCKPGAAESASGLTGRGVHGTQWHAFPPPDVQTIDDYRELGGLPRGGTVRVSLGLVSDISDVERFLGFAERTYRDRKPGQHALTPQLRFLSAWTFYPPGPFPCGDDCAAARHSCRQ
jgi:selenocysteine lyase/cysteine desulfurase